jgi:hypothetical protein
VLSRGLQSRLPALAGGTCSGVAGGKAGFAAEGGGFRKGSAAGGAVRLSLGGGYGSLSDTRQLLGVGVRRLCTRFRSGDQQPARPFSSWVVAMETMVGLLGVVLGALAGGAVTYATTRSRMRLELAYAYDRTLQEKRLEHYQRLFHLSRCVPRQWRPAEEPTRDDLRRFREDFHNWYFGEGAGGMFLTQAAKDLYMRLQNALEMSATGGPDGSGSDARRGSPLSTEESKAMRGLASELRHQMTEDVGAAHPPRLRGTRLGPTIPSPSESVPSAPGRTR